jgi:hypothetical protein
LWNESFFFAPQLKRDPLGCRFGNAWSTAALSQTLFLIGAAIFCLLGVLHAALTVGDLTRPRFFTPTDDSVRRSMTAAPLRLSTRMNIWEAWLGFNLSHSLGLLVFAGVLGGLALQDFGLVAESALLRWASIIGALLYSVLAFHFWFWAPASAAAVGCACFVLSAMLR